jgi:hypothetical protein
MVKLSPQNVESTLTMDGLAHSIQSKMNEDHTTKERLHEACPQQW